MEQLHDWITSSFQGFEPWKLLDLVLYANIRKTLANNQHLSCYNVRPWRDRWTRTYTTVYHHNGIEGTQRCQSGQYACLQCSHVLDLVDSRTQNRCARTNHTWLSELWCVTLLQLNKTSVCLIATTKAHVSCCHNVVNLFLKAESIVLRKILQKRFLILL